MKESRMSTVMKDIEGYEGLYAVTKDGRVWSYPKKNGVNQKGTYLAPKETTFGYLSVGLYKNGKRKVFLVHRLVLSAFICNPQNKPQANHKDGIKKNNNIENLEWNTCSENQIHAYKTGLQSFGTDKQIKAIKENVKAAHEKNKKFSIDTASEICEAFATGLFTFKSAGKALGVSAQTVHNLIKGKTYA